MQRITLATELLVAFGLATTALVNPPWKFDAEARPLLDWLAQALAQGGGGGSKVGWLVPE